MFGMELLSLLLALPLLAAVLCWLARWSGQGAGALATTVHAAALSALLAGTLWAIVQVMALGSLAALGHWVYVDGLGCVFIGLIGLVGFLTGIYAIGYMNHAHHSGEIDVRRLCDFYAIFNLFIFTMMLAATANNIIMMWVAIEATTLGSAFLVGFYGKRASLEAAWKYVVICTVGVAFGLYGVVLVYSNGVSVLAHAEEAAFWTRLMTQAAALDPTLMKIAFVFVLIGFGTKAGLFPMHAWLPDAHSEAPSPVSALLSAVLLNCAMLVVLRFYMLISQSIGPEFPQTLLIIFGMASVAVAAFFIVVQRNMKRLLAYSSVENMGLIALAFGLGGPLGVAAGLLHTINHSLAKALLFCAAGNVQMKYGSIELDRVRGLLRVAPVSATLLIAGALALGGVPPLNVFVSEFMIVMAGLDAGRVLLIVVLLLLLTVVLAGLIRMAASACMGPAPDDVPRAETGWLTLAPMGVLLVAMLALGIRAPAPVMEVVAQATRVVLGVPQMPEAVQVAHEAASPQPPVAEAPPVTAAESAGPGL